MTSHSDLIKTLTSRVSNLVDIDPTQARELTRLIVGIEAGKDKAIQRGYKLIEVEQSNTLPKITAPIPSEIKVSISGAFHNKETNQDWLGVQIAGGFNQFKGAGVYGYSFKSQTRTVKSFIWSVTHGGAWAVGNYTDNFRTSGNFISSQLLALDFDNAVSIDELLEVEFIRHYVSCLHPSPSHTDEHPKTRAIFVLSEPVYDGDRWESYQIALIDYFQNFEPDTKCRDRARFFFGSDLKGAMGNFKTCLPIAVCEQMAQAYEMREADKKRFREQQRESKRMTAPTSDKAKQAYIDTAIDGELRDLSMVGTGNRNNQLFTTACNLYGMVMSGEWGISDGWVTSELTRVASSIGLEKHEIEKTLESANKNADPRYLEIS